MRMEGQSVDGGIGLMQITDRTRPEFEKNRKQLLTIIRRRHKNP